MAVNAPNQLIEVGDDGMHPAHVINLYFCIFLFCLLLFTFYCTFYFGFIMNLFHITLRYFESQDSTPPPSFPAFLAASTMRLSPSSLAFSGVVG